MRVFHSCRHEDGVAWASVPPWGSYRSTAGFGKFQVREASVANTIAAKMITEMRGADFIVFRIN